MGMENGRKVADDDVLVMRTMEKKERMRAWLVASKQLLERVA
jgi:hypothetical protein